MKSWTPEQIKAARKARGWSQQELSNKLRVGLATVSRWETGSHKPSKRSLQDLGRLFGDPNQYV